MWTRLSVVLKASRSVHDRGRYSFACIFGTLIPFFVEHLVCALLKTPFSYLQLNNLSKYIMSRGVPQNTLGTGAMDAFTILAQRKTHHEEFEPQRCTTSAFSCGAAPQSSPAIRHWNATVLILERRQRSEELLVFLLLLLLEESTRQVGTRLALGSKNSCCCFCCFRSY